MYILYTRLVFEYEGKQFSRRSLHYTAAPVLYGMTERFIVYVRVLLLRTVDRSWPASKNKNKCVHIVCCYYCVVPLSADYNNWMCVRKGAAVVIDVCSIIDVTKERNSGPKKCRRGIFRNVFRRVRYRRRRSLIIILNNNNNTYYSNESRNGRQRGIRRREVCLSWTFLWCRAIRGMRRAMECIVGNLRSFWVLVLRHVVYVTYGPWWI